MEDIDFFLKKKYSNSIKKYNKYNETHVSSNLNKKNNQYKSHSFKYNNNFLKAHNFDKTDNSFTKKKYLKYNLSTFGLNYKKNLLETFSNFLDKNKFKLSNKFDEKNSKKFLDKKNKCLEKIILSDIIENNNNLNDLKSNFVRKKSKFKTEKTIDKYFIIVTNYDEEQKSKNSQKRKKLNKIKTLINSKEFNVIQNIY